MSEEDAFLDGIATNRADRTRLLVFADWLADRSDPREEFVRVHTRLLDLDGTEPGFLELEETWVSWVGGRTRYSGSQRSWAVTSPHLSGRWLTAMCRVFTADDAESYLFDDEEPQGAVERFSSVEAGPAALVRATSVTLYRGKPEQFTSPFEFAAATILLDVWDEPFRAETGSQEQANRRYLTPVARGTFWRLLAGVQCRTTEPAAITDTRPG